MDKSTAVRSRTRKAGILTKNYTNLKNVSLNINKAICETILYWN